MRKLVGIALLVSVALPAWTEEGWTERQEVMRGTDLVVAYRARLDGDLLIVEARHGKDWHTYAMDNPVRAERAGGNTKLGLELPTRIALSGGLVLESPWRQSKPKDLSDTEIGWYTWGFEGTVYFAARVKRTDGDAAKIEINAQACSGNACRMVDRLILTLPLEKSAAKGKPAVDFDALVALQTEDEPASVAN